MALTPVAGATYILSAPEGHGQGIGALTRGTEVVVESVTPASDEESMGEVIVTVRNTYEYNGKTHVVPRRIPLSPEDFERLFGQPQGAPA